jgi:hypothetical protein
MKLFHAPVRRWPPQAAEHDANFSCSTSCCELAEYVVIFPMVVAKRELRQIQNGRYFLLTLW